MVTLDLSEEGFQHPYCHLVGAVIIVTIAGEVTLHLIVYVEAGLVADNLHLSVLHGADRVDHMRETGNTCCEGTAHVGIDECQLGSLIEVLVVHIVNQVQRVHIDVG